MVPAQQALNFVKLKLLSIVLIETNQAEVHLIAIIMTRYLASPLQKCTHEASRQNQLFFGPNI
jgi:hypothetical protein